MQEFNALVKPLNVCHGRDIIFPKLFAVSSIVRVFGFCGARRSGLIDSQVHRT